MRDPEEVIYLIDEDDLIHLVNNYDDLQSESLLSFRCPEYYVQGPD